MLTDVLDRVLSYLPRYLASVGVILSRPITEVSARAGNPDCLKDALVFWLISQVLGNVVAFIAYNAQTDEVLYFVGNLIGSSVTLVIFTALFFWSWKLLRSGIGFGAFAAAIAYVWGALTPVFSVLLVISTGLLRLFSPAMYEMFTKTDLGCSIPILPDASLLQGMFDDPAAVAAYLAYGLVVLSSFAMFAAYFVAFLRIVRRLTRMPAMRFYAGSVLSTLLIALAGGVSSFYFQSLMQGAGSCG